MENLTPSQSGDGRTGTGGLTHTTSLLLSSLSPSQEGRRALKKALGSGALRQKGTFSQEAHCTFSCLPSPIMALGGSHTGRFPPNYIFLETLCFAQHVCGRQAPALHFWPLGILGGEWNAAYPTARKGRWRCCLEHSS